MSPNDKELYLKGHIEVPNMLGGDDCGEDFTMVQDYAMPNYGAPALPPHAIVPTDRPVAVGEGGDRGSTRTVSRFGY